MTFNKLNNHLIIQKIDQVENQQLIAEQLFKAADAGFKKGSPWDVEHFFQTLQAKNSLVFAASLSDHKQGESDPSAQKIIGVLIASIAATEVDVYMVVVDEAYKKNRIAYQLFQQLITHCKAQDIESIFLEVRVSNEPAIGLYETLGFKRVGERKAYYSSPIEDAIVMQLKL